MCLLLESIKIVNRQFQSLNYHQARVDYALTKIFGIKKKPDLKKILSIPKTIGPQTFKCRIIYGKKIESIQFIAYQPPQINTLKLVRCDDIDYTFKYANRSPIEKLFAQRETCSDILIVKNNLITDTSFCNILFFNGKKWLTPESPLLKGTKRQQLLDAGKIEPATIFVNDLQHYQKFMLINAMLDFDEQKAISYHYNSRKLIKRL